MRRRARMIGCRSRARRGLRRAGRDASVPRPGAAGRGPDRDPRGRGSVGGRDLRPRRCPGRGIGGASRAGSQAGACRRRCARARRSAIATGSRCECGCRSCCRACRGSRSARAPRWRPGMAVADRDSAIEGERGQATVELVAGLPALLLAGVPRPAAARRRLRADARRRRRRGGRDGACLGRRRRRRRPRRRCRAGLATAPR